MRPTSASRRTTTARPARDMRRRSPSGSPTSSCGARSMSKHREQMTMSQISHGNGPAVTKPEVRRLLRRRIAAIPQARRQEAADAAAARLLAAPEWRNASTIMLYLALPDEQETAALFERALADLKHVVVPRITDTDENRMVAVEIRSLAPDDLRSDHFGVRVPGGEPPEAPLEGIDFIVVPGLGFSRRGDRIGRGKGYYDRFLASPARRASTCGFAFDEQVLDALPADPHDRRLDLLVTPGDVLRFGAGA